MTSKGQAGVCWLQFTDQSLSEAVRMTSQSSQGGWTALVWPRPKPKARGQAKPGWLGLLVIFDVAKSKGKDLKELSLEEKHGKEMS